MFRKRRRKKLQLAVDGSDLPLMVLGNFRFPLEIARESDLQLLAVESFDEILIRLLITRRWD